MTTTTTLTVPLVTAHDRECLEQLQGAINDATGADYTLGETALAALLRGVKELAKEWGVPLPARPAPPG